MLSLSKAQQKEIARLKDQKYRTENNLFLVEGVKMIDDLLASNYTIQFICAIKDWLATTKLNNSSFPVYEVAEEELKKLSNLITPNQVVAVVEIPHTELDNKVTYSNLSLVLDEIKDPGNMGTIIRIADWFGIKNIYCTHTSVDIYNPKVVQATMGSLFRVNIFYTDIIDLLKNKPASFEVYGTLLNGENIYSTQLKKEGFIVIGNESKGISSEIQQYITQKISIPKFGDAGIDSLNAAIATAIVCSEFKRG